jgi:hypothetical protein
MSYTTAEQRGAATTANLSSLVHYIRLFDQVANADHQGDSRKEQSRLAIAFPEKTFIGPNEA